jgi:proteasome alpha subunit
VAVLDRTRTQERKFRRLAAPVLIGILGDQGVAAPAEETSTTPEEPAPAEATSSEETGDEPPIAP